MNSDVIQGLIRHVLTIIGGYFVAKGQLDPTAATTIVGGLSSLIGVVWSIKSKSQA